MQPFWSIPWWWWTSSSELDYLSVLFLVQRRWTTKNPLGPAKQRGIISQSGEIKLSPFFAGKLVADWVRGCAFPSAKPACSSMFLASPVLLKMLSGILSWFESDFTCCSVIVFLCQHNAVEFFGVFVPLWYPWFWVFFLFFWLSPTKPECALL